MHAMRLMSAVLVAVMATGFHASLAQAAGATAWSTDAAACVPVSPSGYFVTAGAVTAGGGVTVTLDCGITRAALSGGFVNIEVTYKGGQGGIVVGDVNTTGARAVIPTAGLVTSELIELSKATGDETVKCGIQAKGSSVITTESNLCENSNLDFNKNFYYLRIVLRSGLIAGQLETVYGSSLTSR